MRIRNWLVPAAILGSAAGLLAFGGPDQGPDGRPDAPPPHHGPRDSTRRAPRPPLTTEQKAFLAAERTLRDSMDLAVRAYAESVRKGSDPRSMVTDRAVLNDFARRLERLRQDNLDIWLDLLATRPPMGPRHRGPRPDANGRDTLPPPPEDDSAQAAP